METIDSIADFRPKRETKYVGARVDYLIDLLLRSKDAVDIYHAATEGIDIKKVHSNYTQRLLVLQEQLNKKNPGLGSDVANRINDRLEALDYFTALGVINHLLKNSSEIPAGEISAVPDIIEGIKGKNGADSRILRYHFVNKWLPRVTKDVSLARLAKSFVKRYGGKAARENAEIEHARQKCLEWYDGDFEHMKKLVTDKIRENLEGAVRQLTLIENAEPVEETSNSDE